VRILRGQAEDGLGKYQNTIEEFESARRQLPRDAIVRFSLGFMYWKVHRFTDPEPELEEAVKLDPDFRKRSITLQTPTWRKGRPQLRFRFLTP
jgi:tetratricopeptide (TPR) repeat protein